MKVCGIAFGMLPWRTSGSNGCLRIRLPPLIIPEMPSPKSTTEEWALNSRAKEAIRGWLKVGNPAVPLDLSGMELTSLPPELGQLTALKELSLSNNQLSALPPELGQLTALTRLYLDNNQLSALPPELGQLTALTTLYLHGNPAVELPPEVLGPTWNEVNGQGAKPASPAAILAYYFAARSGDTLPLNEMKMILVGRGGAGKTATVNQLLRNKFIPGTDETVGIEIADWLLACPGGDPVRVHVWDFAGQTLTHGLHQFFLSSRSIYVLVLAGRDDLAHEDAEYWLRMIGAFGTHREDGQEEPPQVIVTLNKWETERGESRPRVDREALREKYPNVRAFVETDCKTGYGIEGLRKELAAAVAGEKWVRAEYAKTWFRVKERLTDLWQKEAQDYLPYEDYQRVCADAGIPDAEQQAGLARVLHYLGLALNYGDDERLKDTTVLNPHWVTGNIYKLLREAPRDSDAVMTLEHVAGVLPKEPAKMREYLVELMRRFDLAFPLPEKTNHWLVPQRLPPLQPALPEGFRARAATRLRFTYQALPSGMVSKFITRTHILSDDLPECRWLNGVVLELDGAQALVKADHAERTVTVTVIGEESKRPPLMALAQRELRSLHGEIRGLDPKEEKEAEDKPGVWLDVALLEEMERADDRSQMPVLVKKDPPAKAKMEMVSPVEELNTLSPSAVRDEAVWKPKVFISYAHVDERLKDELVMRLKILRGYGLVEYWHDRMIEAGDEWNRRIMGELETADLVLLLISSASLASDYIQSKEMTTALQRHAEGKAIVIPIILERCQWRHGELADLQGLPKDARPVRDWKPRSNGWYEVMEGLRKRIEGMKRGR